MRYYLVLLVLALLNARCSSAGDSRHDKSVYRVETATDTTMETRLTTNHLVQDIARHKAFRGFGDLLLPLDNNTAYYNTRISNISSTMPYHSAVKPEEIVNAVNHLIEEVNNGKNIFYNFYDEEQKKQDSTKKNTGLFFYRGDPDAPFAILCPGGGFSYVGSLHEGFPLASEISKKKLNAFVIRYRIGSEQWATEDLANAIRFIFKNVTSLKVGTNNYSLWGASAGARMVGNVVHQGTERFFTDKYPKPVTAVIAYTGQSTYDKDFPPTFITVSADDRIASAATVDKRVQNLKNVGVTVVYERYKNAGHGFGLGAGTDAEGWLDKAVDFWRRQMGK